MTEPQDVLAEHVGEHPLEVVAGKLAGCPVCAAALVRTPETLDVERIFDALPTTEAEWRPFWHRVDDPDGWVVSIYGHKLAEYVVARLAGEPSDQP